MAGISGIIAFLTFSHHISVCQKNEEEENIHGDQDFEDVEKRDNFCEY